jgi:hypothetical protein
MPGFRALLSDEEGAAVLTDVRHSVGNDRDPVAPAQGGAVRTATGGKTGLYQAGD